MHQSVSEAFSYNSTFSQLFWRCGVVGCWLGFCGRGGLCALEGWRFRLGLVAGWVLLWRWLGVWCWCWVWCFGGGGVRVFNVSVLGVCVCVCVSCGGWCVLAAVVVLVGVRRVGRYRYCRARVHVACARSRGAQTFFWG